MAHYVIDNLSDEAVKLSKGFIRVYAFLSETAIFIYLGLGITAFSNKLTLYRADFITIAFVAMLISRLHTFMICFARNMRSKEKFSFGHQFFLWYCGLRGALCFVMALQLSDNEIFRETYQKLVLSTTLITVFLTIIVMGAFTISVIDFFKLRVNEVESPVSPDTKQPKSAGPLGIKHWDKK
jgi:sodium/hydrogen exchanger 8